MKPFRTSRIHLLLLSALIISAGCKNQYQEYTSYSVEASTPENKDEYFDFYWNVSVQDDWIEATLPKGFVLNSKFDSIRNIMGFTQERPDGKANLIISIEPKTKDVESVARSFVEDVKKLPQVKEVTGCILNFQSANSEQRVVYSELNIQEETAQKRANTMDFAMGEEIISVSLYTPVSWDEDWAKYVVFGIVKRLERDQQKVMETSGLTLTEEKTCF